MNYKLAAFARAALAGVLLLAGLAAGAATTFTEGTHYRVLKPAVSTSVPPGMVEVTEVFWYACGHCYLLEPGLDGWARSKKPSYVQLTRLPAVWNPLVKMHARIFYTSELLGKLPQLHSEAFREINVKGNRLDTPEKIEAFFVSKGVAKEDFQKAFSSFSVESKLRRADELNRRYRIASTPTVVVNGKYVTDVGMAGSEEKLWELINQLAAREKGTTPATGPGG
jgi:thiol:disulfide interchange protein DsbA